MCLFENLKMLGFQVPTNKCQSSQEFPAPPPKKKKKNLPAGSWINKAKNSHPMFIESLRAFLEKKTKEKKHALNNPQFPSFLEPCLTPFW